MISPSECRSAQRILNTTADFWRLSSQVSAELRNFEARAQHTRIWKTMQVWTWRPFRTSFRARKRAQQCLNNCLISSEKPRLFSMRLPIRRPKLLDLHCERWLSRSLLLFLRKFRLFIGKTALALSWGHNQRPYSYFKHPRKFDLIVAVSSCAAKPYRYDAAGYPNNQIGRSIYLATKQSSSKISFDGKQIVCFTEPKVSSLPPLFKNPRCSYGSPSKSLKSRRDGAYPLNWSGNKLKAFSAANITRFSLIKLTDLFFRPNILIKKIATRKCDLFA
jgi:hypothetical protein